MNIKEKFGAKVKSLREEKGHSIKYLANISNVDRNYISDIEKGKRNISIEIIEKLSKVLDVNIQDLFDYENNLNFIDLFAGAGGLSEGFIQQGFNPVAHIEMVFGRIEFYYDMISQTCLISS